VAKSQYDVCAGVLKRLHKEGVLAHFVLIGSWCVLFYEDFFRLKSYAPSIRTRDIDILIPVPPQIPVHVDLPAMLKDMDFVMELKGSKGYMQFLHPDLLLEFLVPERGRGSDRPYPVSALAVNAQPLRYLDLLLREIITLKFEGVPVRVPHPANFAIHKLIVSTRRKAKAEQSSRIQIQ